MDELKTIKNNNYIKEIDDDCESDTHDDNEDFEYSKMKEFNNLLTDVANKSMENKAKKMELKNPKSEREKRSETLNNLENLEEELRFLSELEEMSKPFTVQADRPKKGEKNIEMKQITFAKKDIKNSLEFKRPPIYRTAVLTQNPKEKREMPSNLNSSL
jgi:hypothetical protein